MRRRGRAAAVESGPLVFIRHVRKDDEREVLALKRASRDLHERWEPAPPPGQSWYGPRAFKRLLDSTDTAACKRYLICRADNEEVVGLVSLSQIFRGPFDNAIMGYWVGAACVRKGYGAAGVRLALARAFGALKLHRVEANVMPTNEASIALVRRVGFREEGYSPRYLQIAGRWEDHTRWALTAEDWKAMNNSWAARRPR